jgi:signal transduction histidine kinase
MEQRARQLSGTFVIRSDPEQGGTELTVQIPFRP